MSEFTDICDFIVTKEHRRFVEFCDACRRYRYIGLCYGPPGVGKTVSARSYARQNLVEHLLTDGHMLDLPIYPEILESSTLLYTPSLAHSPSRLEKDIAEGRKQLNDLHYWMQSAMDRQVVHELPVATKETTQLIVVDEADRLKPIGLEQMRDIYDRSQLVADKLIWPCKRLEVPAAFVRQFLANHIPRLLLDTMVPDGREELQEIYRLALKAFGEEPREEELELLQPLFV